MYETPLFKVIFPIVGLIFVIGGFIFAIWLGNKGNGRKN